MTEAEKKFDLFLTVLRFLVFKITPNLKRIYLDIDMKQEKMLLTACYESLPSELELELLDDIVTNCQANVPYFYTGTQIQIYDPFDDSRKHDFVVFAVYEALENEESEPKE